eukprot:1107114-Prymnesium_polylepis.2
MKSKKVNAHDEYIYSAAYNNDGTQIVSACSCGTIKVWDAVNFRPHVESEWETFKSSAEDGGHGDYDIITWWRNKITGHEQSVRPSG